VADQVDPAFIEFNEVNVGVGESDEVGAIELNFQTGPLLWLPDTTIKYWVLGSRRREDRYASLNSSQILILTSVARSSIFAPGIPPDEE
jgi:hypothetical protein